ncbi:MAG: DUF2341 domain-containing protein, partial [Candidatus Paceibacterota bacterium]
IVVGAGGHSGYSLTTHNSQFAGTGWTETLKAIDAQGNLLTSIGETVTMSASKYGIDGTAKRKPVTIAGTSSSALTDYQTRIEVAYDTDMQADFSDIRFSDASGMKLPYYRESYVASTSAVFWVKVPSIPAAPGTVTIYLYYGNSSISTVSNGADTFLNFGLKQEGPVSSVFRHTCAIFPAGTIKCWGNNDYGQLGDGTWITRSTPVFVLGINNAVAVSAGYYHSCALLSDGTAKCWGENGYGQLGDGSASGSIHVPVDVSGLTDAVAISTGQYHTCALISDGTAKCWGDNRYGQLGDASTTHRYIATPVSDLTNAVAIAAGASHNCALLSNGTAKCWGAGGSGRLGNAATTNQTAPVFVSGLTNAVAIVAGNDHTCALLADGTAKCWGNNYDTGKLGVGYFTGLRDTPASVLGIENAVSITVGYGYTCARIIDGSFKCWGANVYGQLGDGSTENRAVAVAVSGIAGAIEIIPGDHHTCALFPDGSLKCWGRNNYGQLGDGTTTDSLTPINVGSYNSGVRYSKVGGFSSFLPLSVPNPVSDVYYMRKYAAVEPDIAETGSEASDFGSASVKFYTDGTYVTETSAYALSGGLATVYVKDAVSETFSIAATDAGSKTGSSEDITVYPADTISYYTITATTPQFAGVPWTEKIQAFNAQGNLVTSDSSTQLVLTSSSSTATFSSASCTLNRGSAEIIVSDINSGTLTITATDFSGKSITSEQITVVPTVSYDVPNPSPQVAGNGWTETISARDVYGHTLTSDSSTVLTVSSTSATAKFYTDDTYTTETTTYTLSSGEVPIYVKDTAVETITISVTDGIISNTSGSIVVNQGDFYNYQVSAHTPQEAGVGWSETVTAQNAYGVTYPFDATISVYAVVDSSTMGPGVTRNYKPITITGSTDGALTDYQVQVNVAYDADMNADFSDVRFTDENQAALSYYRESYTDSTSAVFWVKVPSIPASPGTAIIYLYYGNSSLVTASNGANTFISFNQLRQEGPISAGYHHSCSLLSDGTAQCWGENGSGRLGDGTATQRTTPVAVSNLTAAVALEAGDTHTCALINDGTVKCWGANSNGQLGDASTSTKYTPVLVSGLAGAVALTAGNYHTCALISDGTAKCWGRNNDGQLGDGTTTDSLMPVAVSNLAGAVAITGGFYHTCALLSGGTAMCWGANGSGRLGDGTATQRTTPVAVSNLTAAVALEAGDTHTCALIN